MREQHFRVGQTIFKEGEASHEAYIIRSGRVEILKNSLAGVLRLAVLGEDDVFGEMGLLEERPRSATAQARTEVVATAIGREEFLELLTDHPKQGIRIIRALFERLRDMNQRLAFSGKGQAQDQSLPVIQLTADSRGTRGCLPEEGLQITRFPFRIGRRPLPEELAYAFNEVQITDQDPLTVSLNHLAIELDSDGVIVRDRGSRYGVGVNGTQIGGVEQLDVALLHPGRNKIVVGPPPELFGGAKESYVFRVDVS